MYREKKGRQVNILDFMSFQLFKKTLVAKARWNNVKDFQKSSKIRADALFSTSKTFIVIKARIKELRWLVKTKISNSEVHSKIGPHCIAIFDSARQIKFFLLPEYETASTRTLICKQSQSVFNYKIKTIN